MLILCLVKSFPPTVEGRPFVSGWGLSILWLLDTEVPSIGELWACTVLALLVQ